MHAWLDGRRRYIVGALMGLMVVLVGCPRAAEASVQGDMRAAAIRQRVAEQQARTRAEVNARLEASQLARVALLQTPPTPDPTPSPAPIPRRDRTSAQTATQAPIAPSGDIKSRAYGVVVARGWGHQWGSVDALIGRESGWNPRAVNRSSGACGLPQRLPCSGLVNWPVETQIEWFIDYCVGRYGSPAGGWGHFQRRGWY